MSRTLSPPCVACKPKGHWRFESHSQHTEMLEEYSPAPRSGLSLRNVATNRRETLCVRRSPAPGGSAPENSCSNRADTSRCTIRGHFPQYRKAHRRSAAGPRPALARFPTAARSKASIAEANLPRERACRPPLRGLRAPIRPRWAGDIAGR